MFITQLTGILLSLYLVMDPITFLPSITEKNQMDLNGFVMTQNTRWA